MLPARSKIEIERLCYENYLRRLGIAFSTPKQLVWRDLQREMYKWQTSPTLGEQNFGDIFEQKKNNWYKA
jgi:hypothetical protein